MVTPSAPPIGLAVFRGADGPGGMGRMGRELLSHWAPSDLAWREARIRRVRVPLAGYIPTGTIIPRACAVAYLPHIWGASALGRIRLPSVVTVHDLGCMECPADRASAPRPWTWVMEREVRALAHASRLVAVSDFTRTRLFEHVPGLIPGRVSVIHHGVSDSLLESASGNRARNRRALTAAIPGVRSRSRLMVYVGDEAPRKNIPLLLETLRSLKGRYPTLQLLKIGTALTASGRQRTLNHMKRLRLGPGRDVIFTETIPDPLLAICYRASDVYVSASLYEGFGLPPLEALASGLPVVATRRGAHVELLRHRAILVEPERSAMVAAVRCELEMPYRPRRVDSLRAEMGLYRWNRTAAAYTELFVSLARRSAGSGLVAAESRQTHRGGGRCGTEGIEGPEDPNGTDASEPGF